MKVLQISDEQLNKMVTIKVRELNLNAKDFFKTIFKKHAEVIEKTKLRTKDTEPINWSVLNKHLEDYANDRSWVVSQYWQAVKMRKELERNYKYWYNRKLIDCRGRLKTRPSYEPPLYLMEAEMDRVYGSQVRYWSIKRDNMDLLVGFYKDLRDLWYDQIDVYQTLSSNIRGEIRGIR